MFLIKKGLLLIGSVSYAALGFAAIQNETNKFYTDSIFYIYAIIGVTVSLVYSSDYLKPKQWLVSYLSAAVVCMVLIELKKNGQINDNIYYLVTLGASSAAPTILGVWFSFVANVKQDGGKVLSKAALRRLSKWIGGSDDDYYSDKPNDFDDYGSE